jgi:phage FluMu protein Com
MLKTSHLQELKRRYASMYAPPIEEKVIEDGTIEGANQYRKDTPGQEEVEVAESFELQATMALDDVGIKSNWKKGKLYVAKRDIKKAEKALGKSFKKMKKGAEPDLYYEEVEIDEARKPTRTTGMECMECGKKFRTKLSTLQYGKTKCPKCKSTDLDFAFGESVEEEVEIEEQQIDEKGTAYPATIDTLRMIVKDKQHQTVMFKSGKAIVDLFTASAMVQVYDALKKPDMKKTFEKMIADKAGFMKTQAFAMKMIG